MKRYLGLDLSGGLRDLHVLRATLPCSVAKMDIWLGLHCLNICKIIVLLAFHNILNTTKKQISMFFAQFCPILCNYKLFLGYKTNTGAFSMWLMIISSSFLFVTPNSMFCIWHCNPNCTHSPGVTATLIVFSKTHNSCCISRDWSKSWQQLNTLNSSPLGKVSRKKETENRCVKFVTSSFHRHEAKPVSDILRWNKVIQSNKSKVFSRESYFITILTLKLL